MFVITNYINRLKQDNLDWQISKRKYIELVDPDEWQIRQWCRVHPVPHKFLSWKYIKPKLIHMLIFLSLWALVCLVIFSIVNDNKNNQKEQNTVIAGKTCRSFNKNDHVRIQYGDYEGVLGTIVGGCESGQEYQLQIDKNTQIDLPDDNKGAVNVGETVIGINSYKNMTVIGKEK